MSNPEFSLDTPLKEQQEKFMQISDENIDYSDIPLLDDEFFKNAKLVKLNPQTEQKGMISIVKLKGTIQLFLEGSEGGLQRLANLHQSGELQALLNKLKPDDMPEIVVTKVEFTTDAKVIEKAELIKTIREGTIDKTTLQQVDLSGADLRRGNLWGVKPSETDLSEADLSGAILSGAILKRADLSGADLWRANLSGANLSSTNLSGADLSGAGVENAIFIDATGITPEQKQDLIRRGAIFAEI
jgi:hypothetical protein